MSPDQWSLAIAARTIWGEARGEPPVGQRAVAWVLRNRLATGHWGTLAEVALAPLQFSCWNSRDPNRMAMAALRDKDSAIKAFSALMVQVLGESDGALDPSLGATHYVRAGTPAPWLEGAVPTVLLGHHQFFRGLL